MARENGGDGRKPAKVLIVDDHPVVREGLTALISAQPGLVVCGGAESPTEAIRLFEETAPDLVIVDISLKGGDGIELIKRIKTRNESARILVSSMHDESLYAERALRAGSMGYIGKQESTSKIIAAIRGVLDGRVYLSERMADRLLHRVVSGREEGSPIESLTDRELQVFDLIGQGLNTRQIANRLHLSSKTVETYRGRIRAKLNLGPGFELTRFAMQWVLESSRPGT
jgi:DNA-binding NarL/FixJ family response regulator